MGIEQNWLGLAESFQNAAIDGHDWREPLQGLAVATGSRSAQLLGLSSGASGVLEVEDFNIVTNVDPTLAAIYRAAGGSHPAFNTRVRVRLSAPELHVLTESDFLSPEEHVTDPYYAGFAWPGDLPFSCLTSLLRQDDLMVGLAVLRSRREGPVTPAQRFVFRMLAPHVRAAVRTRLALDRQGGHIVAGLLEAVSVPAFLCDPRGRVKAFTPSAEALLEGPSGLKIRGGRLAVPAAAENQALERAIAAAAPADTAPRSFQTVVVRGSHGQMPLVLDVIALPGRNGVASLAPQVLVAAGGPARSADQKTVILRSGFSLTAAEADIALRLAAGESAEEIAVRRAVAVGTVRAQTKTLLSKVGVGRQAELVALLARFGF